MLLTSIDSSINSQILHEKNNEFFSHSLNQTIANSIESLDSNKAWCASLIKTAEKVINFFNRIFQWLCWLIGCNPPKVRNIEPLIYQSKDALITHLFPLMEAGDLMNLMKVNKFFKSLVSNYILEECLGNNKTHLDCKGLGEWGVFKDKDKTINELLRCIFLKSDTISVSFVRIKLLDFKCVEIFLKNNPHICKLKFYAVDLNDANLNFLSKCMQNVKELNLSRGLIFPQVHLTQKGMQLISDHCEKLESIKLEDLGIDGATLEVLFAKRKIKQLCISAASTEMEESGLSQEIIDGLAKGAPFLEHVTFIFTKVDGNLSPFFSAGNSLKSVNLIVTMQTVHPWDEQCPPLGHLASHQNLEEVNLFGYPINKAESQVLFSKCPQLKFISLEEFHLNLDSNIQPNLPHLEMISLKSRGSFSDQKLIESLILSCPKLSSMHLQINLKTPEDILKALNISSLNLKKIALFSLEGISKETLKKFLQKFPNLESLSLGKADCLDDDMMTILAEHCKSLKEFAWALAPITSKGLDTLEGKNPNIRIFALKNLFENSFSI